MPKNADVNLSGTINFDGFQAAIAKLMSKRPVRSVVTRSGHRARGKAPSLKATKQLTFESLVEEDFLRVAEVSPLIRAIQTRPYVLALDDRGKKTHYTPDVEIRTERSCWLVEVKGNYWLHTAESRRALSAVIRRLKSHGLQLLVVSEEEIRKDQLQDELRELLRQRPAVPGYRVNLDTSLWDPLDGTEPDTETLRRWRKAQAVCDELLTTVMGRDPDEFVQQFN